MNFPVSMSNQVHTLASSFVGRLMGFLNSGYSRDNGFNPHIELHSMTEGHRGTVKNCIERH